MKLVKVSLLCEKLIMPRSKDNEWLHWSRWLKKEISIILLLPETPSIETQMRWIIQKEDSSDLANDNVLLLLPAATSAEMGIILFLLYYYQRWVDHYLVLRPTSKFLSHANGAIIHHHCTNMMMIAFINRQYFVLIAKSWYWQWTEWIHQPYARKADDKE